MSHVELDLIRKYDVKGPRYTSYPTALQFSELDQADYERAVTTSGRADGDISLYVHIPFCRYLCYYCACSKIVTRDHSKATRYLTYLKRELAAQGTLFKGRTVSQLHWGGGTPTFLDDEQICSLMTFIREHFTLASDEAGEFGIEIDPRTVDGDRMRALRKAGFNRLSFGIQDFEPRVQKAVNREQSFESTQAIMTAARAAGFRSISVDLIYGLPFQTLATIGNTLRKVIELAPNRISIYNYAHLPARFPPQKRISLVDLPQADEKLLILKAAIDMLTGAGYRYIGMDHFAKPDDELSRAQEAGELHRNFQGYSTRADCDMVAVGLTSISQVGRLYAQNAKEMNEYEAMIDNGKLPIQKGVAIDDDDAVRREIIMALICQFRLSFADIAARFNVDVETEYSAALAKLAPMVEDGLLTIDHDGIVVSDAGRLLIRNICMAFDRYLNPADEKRYSRAI